MAVAFDAVSAGGFDIASSLTFSHTAAGGADCVLFVPVVGSDGGSDLVTSVTFNGDALTKIGSSIRQTAGTRWLSFWRLVGADAGTHDVIVSASGSDVLIGISASYTGAADQNASNTGTDPTGPLSVSVTTVTDNSWVVGGAQTSGSTTPGAGTTERGEHASGVGIYDNNGPVTPAGADTLDLNFSGGPLAMIAVALPPTGSAGRTFALSRF